MHPKGYGPRWINVWALHFSNSFPLDGVPMEFCLGLGERTALCRWRRGVWSSSLGHFFTLKWRVKNKAWKKNKVETGLDNFNVHIYNYMYIYIYVCVVVPRCCSCFFFWESFMSRRAPFIHLECWIFDQQNGCLFWLSRMALVTSIRSIDIWLQGAASFDTVSSPYYTPKSAISKTCTEHLPNLNLTSYLLCY